MSSTKLHIEGGTGRPDAIKSYLDLIDRREYDSASAVMEDAYVEFNLTRPNKTDREVDTKGMLTTLSNLGLVEENNRQQLTELGEEFIDVIIYNEDAFFALFHLLYSTAYYRNPSSNTGISWSYFQISDAYRRRAPTNFSDSRQEVIEEVMEKADRMDSPVFADPGPLSKRSLNSYRRFIEKLDPPVLEDGTFDLRSFAEKELVLGAVDSLYRSDEVFETLRYGDRLELSEESKNFLCTVLLVHEDDLAEILEHTASMDGRLSIESDYSIRIRLTKEVNIDDLA